MDRNITENLNITDRNMTESNMTNHHITEIEKASNLVFVQTAQDGVVN